jgi:glycosyltransferase involved in cell wall biosynthesis
MRILMLTQFYPPYIGGEERHVYDLSVELATRGHHVAVATLWQEGMPTFECDRGIHVYRIRGSLQRMTPLFIDQERRYAPPFADPEVLLALRRIIMHERPDIVHAHNWIVHSFTPLKTWSKVKLIVTLHDCSLACAQKRFMYHEELCTGPSLKKCLGCTAEYYGIAKGVPITLANWAWEKIERWVVDMFLPVSQAVAEANQLARHEVSYRVIPNFIRNDMDIAGDDMNSFLAQLPTDDFLLFVGDVVRDKGIELLFRAHTEMGCQIPLVLLGPLMDGPLKDVPPNVHLLHSWPRAVVLSAWSRCTIALMPSLCLDACPTVAMEAMAMGRPVVASRIGGLPDIVVDGETGFLVPPGDWRALQEAIQRLLDDPVLRERMGTKAKQRVVQFQARTVAPRIEQVYQEILQS